MRWNVFITILLVASLRGFTQEQPEVKDTIACTDSISIDSTIVAGYQYFKDHGICFDSSSNLNLYNLIYEWIGTPYKYAGSTPDGIDCSGFVKFLYDSIYSHELLGGSADIFNVVEPIDKEDLREGDLVFFKIRRGRISHVGLYLSNNKFVHATTQRGVMLSDLDEEYYLRYFFSAGRISTDVK